MSKDLTLKELIEKVRTAKQVIMRMPRIGNNPKTPYMHLCTAAALAVSYMDTCKEFGVDPITGRVVNNFITTRPDKLFEHRENLQGIRGTITLRLARAMSAVNSLLMRDHYTLYPEGLVHVPYIAAHPSDKDVEKVLTLASIIAKAWFYDEFAAAGTTRLDKRYF